MTFPPNRKGFSQPSQHRLNDGSTFGHGGEGFVRFNFGCPRATVQLGLDRMAESLAMVGVC